MDFSDFLTDSLKYMVILMGSMHEKIQDYNYELVNSHLYM